MTKFYAGIGSRQTPPEILKGMEMIGYILSEEGYTLRSGGAIGADTAFEDGCDQAEGQKEIFRAKDCEDWAIDTAAKYMPPDRPPIGKMKPYVQKLLGRNMMQVLGSKENPQKVDFIICWTMAEVKDGGGTGYAMRCAQDNGIPIYNLRDEKQREEFYQLLKEIRERE